MLPYIQDSLFPSFFFIIFITVGIYLIKNITLASVNMSYGDSAKMLIEKKEKYRVEMYNCAFDIIRKPVSGYITVNQWEELFSYLRSDLPKEIIRAFFEINARMDEDKGELLMDKKNFHSALELIDIRAKRRETQENVVNKPLVQYLLQISKNTYFRHVMDIAAVTSCILCIVQVGI